MFELYFGVLSGLGITWFLGGVITFVACEAHKKRNFGPWSFWIAAIFIGSVLWPLVIGALVLVAVLALPFTLVYGLVWGFNEYVRD